MEYRDEENAYRKKHSILQQRTHKIGFSANQMLVCIFV